MRSNSCPHCHTRSGLNQYKVFILSLDNWIELFLCTLVVAAFGAKFNYSLGGAVIFALLAAVPIIFTFEDKVRCDNCGVDFGEGTKRSSSRSAPDVW